MAPRPTLPLPPEKERQLADGIGGRGGRGAESHDRKKAWSSIYQSMPCGLDNHSKDGPVIPQVKIIVLLKYMTLPFGAYLILQALYYR